ncbi:hypothetical protein JOM56_001676, partial [Amanita muscaria]
ERLKKKWNAPIYAFFKETPLIEYNSKGDRLHVFECNAPHCRAKGKNDRRVPRNTATTDSMSTSNLKKHAIQCWGQEVVDAANEAKSVSQAREILKKKKADLCDGSLVIEFERMGKGKVQYSTWTPSKVESCASHVHWIAESKRALSLVNDAGYLHLMKTGWPGHYTPSRRTLSRDIQLVFNKAREQIAGRLQAHDGELNIATDAWTSPNHRALVAVTIHYEHKGVEVNWLLDN